ncbi:MAG: hypothetical protein ACKVU4_15300 [Phycisphaerales bacterium]
MRAMMRAAWTAVGLTALATAATAQTVLMSEDFEEGAGEWTVNGIPTLFPGAGNPGQAIGLPYGDFWGVTLRNETPGSVVLGDLTRHGGALTFDLDVSVLQLNNWIPKPMPPAWFPFVIEFVDYPEPGSIDPPVSVYYTGPGLPPTGTWGHYTFNVPDTTSKTLPPGWGGTGAEHPVTLEPMLPPGRTYTSVLQNVNEMRFTTFVPGYFYIANFWEVVFDNVNVTVEGGTCYPDCNESGNLTVADFGCFQGKYVLGDLYADCNASGALTVADFGCFQGKYVLGCP